MKGNDNCYLTFELHDWIRTCVYILSLMLKSYSIFRLWSFFTCKNIYLYIFCCCYFSICLWNFLEKRQLFFYFLMKKQGKKRNFQAKDLEQNIDKQLYIFRVENRRKQLCSVFYYFLTRQVLDYFSTFCSELHWLQAEHTCIC